MTHISDRVQSLSPSQTLAMSQKSNELKAQGIDVINLSVGEPDFNTPDHIKEAAKRAIDENFTFYTAVPGYLSLRKAIADKLKNENGLDYTPEQIVVSGGAKQSLCNVILSVINPGDEVVIPTPAWVSYVEMVKLAEGTNVLVPASIEQDFKVTPEQLEAAITPKTRMVLICSPSNPTGSVYTKDELKGLVEAKGDAHRLIADELQRHFHLQRRFHRQCAGDGTHQLGCVFPGLLAAHLFNRAGSHRHHHRSGQMAAGLVYVAKKVARAAAGELGARRHAHHAPGIIIHHIAQHAALLLEGMHAAGPVQRQTGRIFLLRRDAPQHFHHFFSHCRFPHNIKTA